MADDEKMKTDYDEPYIRNVRQGLRDLREGRAGYMSEAEIAAANGVVVGDSPTIHVMRSDHNGTICGIPIERITGASMGRATCKKCRAGCKEPWED